MTRDEFRAWCRTHRGLGYIMGATGWVCTEARLQQQAKQYAAYDGDPNYGQKTILGIGRKWLGKRCWDCAQWTKYALKQLGVTLPSGATNQFNADAWLMKGPIGTFPWGIDTTGYVLWRQSKKDLKRMSHVALVIGQGRQMDARGTAQGIVEDDSIRNFDFWGFPRGLAFVDGSQPILPPEPIVPDGAPIITAPSEFGHAKTLAPDLIIRKEPDKSAAPIRRMPEGSVVEVFSEVQDSDWVRVKWINPFDKVRHEGYCMIRDMGMDFLEFW